MLQFDYDISSKLDALTDNSPFWSMIAEFCARWLLLLFFGASVLVILQDPHGDSATLMVMLFLLSASFSYLITMVLSLIVRRKRPYERLPDAKHLTPPIYTPSFPSGHATLVFAMATWFMLFFGQPALSISAFIVAAVVALARVVVGVHYLTDVLVGAFTGIVGTYLFIWLLERLLLL